MVALYDVLIADDGLRMCVDGVLMVRKANDGIIVAFGGWLWHAALEYAEHGGSVTCMAV